jgi:hypothetical protein
MKSRIASVFAMLSLALALVGTTPATAGWRPTTGIAAWYDGDLPTSSFRLAPTFALDGSKGVLVGGAMLAGSEMQAPYRSSRLASGWVLDPLRRLPLELRASAAHRGGPNDPNRGVFRGEARLHFASPGLGAWMALATERAYGLSGHLMNPLIGFGAWTRRNGLVLSLDLEQRAGVLPQAGKRDSAYRASADLAKPEDRLLRVALTTTRATLRWSAGRLELESVGGVTLSLLREPKRWAQGSLTYQVAPEVAMFSTFGSRDPELYLIEPAETPRATLGLRMSHWRSAVLDAPLVARAGAIGWRARQLDNEWWALEVRAPGARLVEVAGDFSRWEPVKLEHVGGDRWETMVALEPGVHQVNVRVDGGAWMPPPGAPTSADGYGGTSGVVVAE